MKKIVILRSNPVDPDPRVEKLADTLAGARYEIQVLAWDRTGQLPATEKRRAWVISRFQLPSPYGSGMRNLPRLLRWQYYLFKWLIVNRKSFESIHACDFDTVLPAIIVGKLFRKKVVYDIFDFFSDSIRNTPAPLPQIVRWIDLMMIRLADGVVLADESRWEQIKSGKPRKWITIYNTPYDISDKVESATSQRPRDSQLHLAYVGVMFLERGLLEILELMLRHPEWTLDLAGFGGDEEEVLKKASELPNVTWHGRIPYDRALSISNAADVLFATYDPSIPNHRYSSPNKVFEAMMLGKPIIVAKNTNMDRIISKAECGIIVEYGNVSAIEDALIKLAEDQELREHLGKNARIAYERSYSWQRMEKRLLSFYQEIWKD